MSKVKKEVQAKADAKRAGTRTRNWTAIAYPDDLPSDWSEKLDDTYVKWVCSPLHDKDLNADGQPKKPHYHLLLIFETVKNEKQVHSLFADLFGSDGDSIFGIAKPQIVSDRCALVRYMAHLDNPSKYQYDVADIVGHNGVDVAEILRHTQTETIQMMIAVEEYIEEHHVTELCDLARMIRYEHPDWYTLVATKCTVYFNAFIRSYRGKLYTCNPETGEVVRRED